MKEQKTFFYTLFYPETANEDVASNSFNISKPLGNNSINSLTLLYSDREYYSEYIIPFIKKYTSPNLIFGDLLNKNALYGLVDEELNSIYPIETFLKRIPSATEEPKYVMDFVADAFNQLNAYLSTAALTGKISREGPFFNLKAHRAWVRPQVLLDYTEERLLNSFRDEINNNKILSSKLIDGKTFNKYFIQFLKSNIKSGVPVTKTSVLLSSNFSTFINGLMIDFKKDKADDDTLKYENYWNNKDFPCFADACRKFGFKIDVNVPWRLMIDLNSPAVIKDETTGKHNAYLTNYGINNITELFSNRYQKTMLDELEYIKQLFFNIYTQIAVEFPYYELDYNKLTIEDFNKRTVFERPIYNKQSYEKLFSDTYWMRVYAYLRNFEEKRNLKQQEFDNIVRKANDFINIKRNEDGLNIINNYFKQFKEVYYFSLQKQQEDVQLRADNLVLYDLVF